MLNWRKLHLFIKPITVVFSFNHRMREAKQITEYLASRINIRNC